MSAFDSKLKKNPVAYLSYLQSQNRAKKQVEQQDKEKIINKQKEEAFNIYLQGANEERVEEQRKREKVKIFKEKKPTVMHSRKKWGSGVEIKSNVSRRENIHPDAYSSQREPIRSESLKVFENKFQEGEERVDISENYEKRAIIDLIQDFDPDELCKVLSFMNLTIKENIKRST